MKKTCISSFRINAGDRERQGWAQRSSQTDRMEEHFPARATGFRITTGCGFVPYAFDISLALSNGGERGIRTPDTRKGIHAFEARAFSHSAISPRPLVSFLFYQGSCWLRISPPISLH